MRQMQEMHRMSIQAISSKPQIIEVPAPPAPKSCFLNGQIVTRVSADGTHERVAIEEIKEHDQVLTSNAEGVIAPKQVGLAMNHEAQLHKLVDITLASGKTIQSTDDHYMQVWTNGAYEMKAATDVQRGDILHTVQSGSDSLVEESITCVRRYKMVVPVSNFVAFDNLIVNDIVTTWKARNGAPDCVVGFCEFISEHCSFETTHKTLKTAEWFCVNVLGV